MLLFQSSYSSEIPTSWSNIENVPTHRLPYVHLISSTLSTRSKDTLIGNIELQYRNWSYATFLVPWRPHALSPSLLKVNLLITADVTPVVLITCYLTSFPCSLFQLHLKDPFTTAGMRPLCALAPHIAQNPIMARCLCLVTSSTVLLITQLYPCVSYRSRVHFNSPLEADSKNTFMKIATPTSEYMDLAPLLISLTNQWYTRHAMFLHLPLSRWWSGDNRGFVKRSAPAWPVSYKSRNLAW